MKLSLLAAGCALSCATAFAQAPPGVASHPSHLETSFASDEIAQFWHAAAFDLGRRQQLLARALAAGRPVGMRSWAHDGKQDTEITDVDGPH